MKNNIYPFPQGKQKEAVRKSASQSKRKRFFASFLKLFFQKGFIGLGFRFGL